MQLLNKHSVKILPNHFDASVKNHKPYELRKDDRNYQVNDLIELKEWTPSDGYTGRVVFYVITHKLTHHDIEGLMPGWCSLGLGRVPHVMAVALFMGGGITTATAAQQRARFH